MSKRFTDTEKYKKKFIRELPGAYKLFWDYLYHDCSFAGIWYVDFEVAQIRIGKDMPIDKEEAIKLFNKDEERIIILNGGSKWFIKAFILFQYGELNSNNKLHLGVSRELENSWEVLIGKKSLMNRNNVSAQPAAVHIQKSVPAQSTQVKKDKEMTVDVLSDSERAEMLDNIRKFREQLEAGICLTQLHQDYLQRCRLLNSKKD